MYTLTYFDAVKTDIVEAKDWYRKQQQGLEKKLAVEISNCIKRLQKNPLNYEVKYRNVRTAFTSVFPYAIHFYIDGEKKEIIIVAIVHQKRNPALSHDR